VEARKSAHADFEVSEIQLRSALEGRLVEERLKAEALEAAAAAAREELQEERYRSSVAAASVSSETVELRASFSELQSQNLDLKGQVADLVARCSELDSQLVLSRAQISDLETAAAGASSFAATMASELARKDAELTAAVAAAAEAEAMAADAFERISASAGVERSNLQRQLENVRRDAREAAAAVEKERLARLAAERALTEANAKAEAAIKHPSSEHLLHLHYCDLVVSTVLFLKDGLWGNLNIIPSWTTTDGTGFKLRLVDKGTEAARPVLF